MTLNTNSNQIVPAMTGPIEVRLAGPYRRATPVRHRRSVTSWQAERVVKVAQAWLGQRSHRTRRDMVVFGAACAASTVIADLILLVVAR